MANKPTLVGTYSGNIPVHQGVDNGDVVIAPSGATINADTVAGSTPTQLRVYDIGCFIAGKPEANANVFMLNAPRAFTLTASGHRWVSGGAAAVASSFAFQKWTGSAWSSLGSLTCGVGAWSGTFSLTQTSFAAGEIFRIVSPSSQDSTLADVGIYLTATF